jgi:hypothetical protein
VGSRRFTVSQAAKYLSTTESSIRHKVNRNSISHERDEETNRVYILIDEVEDEVLTEDTQRHTNGEPSDTERLIATLTMQLEATQESLEQEREANRENRRLLAAALERIPAIEAPPEARDAPVSSSEDLGATGGPEGQETPQEPAQRRGWWREFFGLR